MMQLNNVGWFEIGSDQPKETQEFYGKLFGWKFLDYNDMENEYHNILEPGQKYPTGGVLGTDGKIPEYSTFYILVNDVPAMIKKAEEAGGKVIWGPVTDKTGLTFVRLEDNGGHQFGMFSSPQ
ncbi:VOC family protein [uncultured Limosilactobacillus sp.]|uniref:VOC family protein n=1 Tax=uncultured Limosilactobacillus sp. TaxID=2837629 RepID=UPI002600940D|nr:VOC family protein [uncultured Limosilactobacillus sp.]